MTLVLLYKGQTYQSGRPPDTILGGGCNFIVTVEANPDCALQFPATLIGGHTARSNIDNTTARVSPVVVSVEPGGSYPSGSVISGGDCDACCLGTGNWPDYIEVDVTQDTVTERLNNDWGLQFQNKEGVYVLGKTGCGNYGYGGEIEWLGQTGSGGVPCNVRFIVSVSVGSGQDGGCVQDALVGYEPPPGAGCGGTWNDYTIGPGERSGPLVRTKPACTIAPQTFSTAGFTASIL